MLQSEQRWLRPRQQRDAVHHLFEKPRQGCRRVAVQPRKDVGGFLILEIAIADAGQPVNHFRHVCVREFLGEFHVRHAPAMLCHHQHKGAQEKGRERQPEFPVESPFHRADASFHQNHIRRKQYGRNGFAPHIPHGLSGNSLKDGTKA